jgi:hypothetical protein
LQPKLAVGPSEERSTRGVEWSGWKENEEESTKEKE